jgi:L-serine/L-threonine ammonia-lyase
VHPFDDPDTWTGHATLVHETVADLAKATRMMTKDAVSPSDDERNTKIAAIVTCVGGGGLLAGILQGLRETGLSEHTRVVAAETLGADSMTTSLEAGKVVTLPGITSVAKSLGAAAPSSTVFAMAYELYDRDEKSRLVMPLRVTDHDAVNACLRFADDHRVLVEPACGAALAAVYGGQKKAETWLKGLKDGPVVVEVCGGAIVDRGVLEAYAKQFGIEE